MCTICSAISKYDEGIHGELFSNIIPTGGSTMFHGFGERLQKEVEHFSPSNKVKILFSPERKNMAWIGGSILASLSSFRNMWISRKEYEEEGPAVVLSRCF